MQTNEYAQWFRRSTPYISTHRGKTFVVLLPGEALEHRNLPNIVHDLALLHVLGVRLVLVHGARPQIEAALAEAGMQSDVHEHRRITSADVMIKVTAANGVVRSRLEALFSTGLPNTPMHNVDIPVVAGNFTTARPVGIVGGVDHLFTGEVRNIKTTRVQAALAANALVLQSPLGYSTSGQVFNLTAEDVAATMAVRLNADKLIVFNDQPITDAQGHRVSTLVPSALATYAENSPSTHLDALLRAVRGGVPKSHLVNYTDDGALLAELFTAQGVGTQILEHPAQAVRAATLDDVAGIVEIIRPLEERGILVRRERDRLEQEIGHFLVAELDGAVAGCCAVYAFADQAELACVAVHENYRKQSGISLGAALLNAAETRARELHAAQLFVLTTQTSDWFREQGFADASVDDLPHDKQHLYNWRRNSAVMRKTL